MIQIQATFIGYSGKACSLFSALDPDTDILVIGAEAEYRTQRREGCIVITNNRDIPRDSFFSEDDIKEAISSYYTLKAGVAVDNKSSRLVFSERAVRANPEQSIEKDGIDENGIKFRISESISCGQMAALATCLYAVRANTVERTVQLMEEFSVLSAGGIVTI